MSALIDKDIVLVYHSRIPSKILPTDIKNILSSARKNNSRDNITGALFSDASHFYQILEGPEARVKACFERISKDTRHKSVKVMMQKSQHERMFSSWDMMFLNLDDIDPKIVRRVLGFEKKKINPYSVTGGQLLELARESVAWGR